ncbi:protein FAM161B isoform X2 [Denticeps clupeoides]|uniref:FAM161 centrosomal protein B n=3 Tax=Denticeps clupeoides TaxID=299321 RepID=A0AAY4AY78_9TELE|nr:protein FAM161B isoform X2 [Denticeps clupeoides]XP_028827919.1 protein FAM161B isoform X2 [Denticeps clupeoides]
MLFSMGEGMNGEIFLGRHLEVLKASHKLSQHQANLESRLLQMTLLCKDDGSSQSNGSPEGLNQSSNEANGSVIRYYGPRRSSSMSDLQAKAIQCRQVFPPRKKEVAFQPTHTFHRKEDDEAECLKQFRATAAPVQVFQAQYDEIIQRKEQQRQEGNKKRQNYLLSMQRPFSFLQREDEKRKRLTNESRVTSGTDDGSVKKSSPKSGKEVQLQPKIQQTLKVSSAPNQGQTTAEKREFRGGQRSKNKALAFLDVRPSFHPKTNARVPDFDRLHQAFQREAVKRAVRKDATRCQPFQLRTSALPPRQRTSSLEKHQDFIDGVSLKRSSSFGGLTSLSMDTLPTYITDAARKRSIAIRKSMEEKESEERGKAQWMRRHRINSENMRDAVTLRAKAVDPHSSLKDIFQEKLKQHRMADQQRVREYKRELKEMKARVTARPYLFEQLLQKNAKSHAERRYRNTLHQVGLDEEFVKAKGEGVDLPKSVTYNQEVHSQSMGSDSELSGGCGESGENSEEESEESVKTEQGGEIL